MIDVNKPINIAAPSKIRDKKTGLPVLVSPLGSMRCAGVLASANFQKGFWQLLLAFLGIQLVGWHFRVHSSGSD
jgi:hypothetical protein